MAVRDRATLPELLRELASRQVRSKDELTAWYEAAKSVKDLLADPKASSSVPAQSWHKLWHYLSDADIRFKDADYASIQNRFVQDLIRQLEQDAIGGESAT